MKVNELYGNEPITVESYLEKCGVEDTKEYLNPTGKYIDEPMLYKNMIEAIQLFKYHYLQNSTVYILYDSDLDGYTSGTIMYQYMKMLNENWDIKILLHNGKTRGLEDEELFDRVIDEKPNLLIIPDANTNVIEQTRKIFNNGTDILVLDHHEIQTPIDCGVLISNQFDNEEVDRNGSGCLVTHMFLRALDNEFNVKYNQWFVDMVSLSIISDSMDVSSMQNREYLYYGVLQPTLKVRGKKTLIISTPNGKDNIFYKLYNSYPSITKTIYDDSYCKDIEAIKKNTPEIIFKQEYLC